MVTKKERRRTQDFSSFLNLYLALKFYRVYKILIIFTKGYSGLIPCGEIEMNFKGDIVELIDDCINLIKENVLK